jgi:hypothetical protein
LVDHFDPSSSKASFQWDEKNLQENEELKAEMGPRMKIDEPDTPYHPSFDIDDVDTLPPDMTLGADGSKVEMKTPPHLCRSMEGTKVKTMNSDHVSKHKRNQEQTYVEGGRRRRGNIINQKVKLSLGGSVFLLNSYTNGIY